MKKQLALVAALAGLFAGTANAAVITTAWTAYDAGYVNHTTNWGSLATPIQLSVAGFDSMGGTRILDSARVFWEGGFDSAGQADSEDNSAVVLTLGVTVIEKFILGGAGGTKTLTMSGSDDYSLTADDEPGAANYLGGDWTGMQSWAGTGGNSFLYTSATDLNNLFIDEALYSVGAYAVSGLIQIGTANLATSIDTGARARVMVEYTYHDAPPPPSIPEPATLGLLGLGLLGLGMSRRKRA